MAVLIEGISVVVRRVRIDECYPDGWHSFVRDVPNATLCADPHIARVGFMTPDDARRFVDLLGIRGLRFAEDQEATDLAVVDQLSGVIGICSWLEFGHVTLRTNRVSACRLKGDDELTLATPQGWVWEKSLSREGVFSSSAEVGDRFFRLQSDGGVETHLDLKTGRELFLGRAFHDDAPQGDAPNLGLPC
ncbi:MAG: hypothetical protein EXR93_09885 [Gemmatimonadetes bacterium]|nr:hypothetical protein [Gemmatimonadota bacterium]